MKRSGVMDPGVKGGPHDQGIRGLVPQPGYIQLTTLQVTQALGRQAALSGGMNQTSLTTILNTSNKTLSVH